MNKGGPLHSFIDFQLLFHNDEQSDNEEPASSTTISSCRDLQLSKSHQSNYSTWEFIHALNAVVEITDTKKLQHAKYFSLLLDELNDISNVKNLLIYCQFLDTEKRK